jgi:hypothetical protein
VNSHGNKEPIQSAHRPAGRVSVVLLVLWTLAIPLSSDAQSLTITNFTSYVDVHFITIPNKNNFLQAAWVYPTNGIRLGYTNLVWANVSSYPATPLAAHLFYKDYSVTNRIPNRYRIYRSRAL